MNGMGNGLTALKDARQAGALGELIARLEAAVGPDRELDCLISIKCTTQWRRDVPESIILAELMKPHDGFCHVEADRGHIPRHTSSLDAALTLVPEDFYWEVAFGVEVPSGGPYWAELYHKRALSIEFVSGGKTAALATCAAALKARQLAKPLPYGPQGPR